MDSTTDEKERKVFTPNQASRFMIRPADAGISALQARELPFLFGEVCCWLQISVGTHQVLIAEVRLYNPILSTNFNRDRLARVAKRATVESATLFMYVLAEHVLPVIMAPAVHDAQYLTVIPLVPVPELLFLDDHAPEARVGPPIAPSDDAGAR